LELIIRRYERASTLLASNRPVDDWGKLLGDTAAVTALLDRLLHHAHVLKCGPSQLADESADRLARGGRLEVELASLGNAPRHRWRPRQSWDFRICNLQNLQDAGKSESHS